MIFIKWLRVKKLKYYKMQCKECLLGPWSPPQCRRPSSGICKNTTRLVMCDTSFGVSEQYQVFLDQTFSFINILV